MRFTISIHHIISNFILFIRDVQIECWYIEQSCRQYYVYTIHHSYFHLIVHIPKRYRTFSTFIDITCHQHLFNLLHLAGLNQDLLKHTERIFWFITLKSNNIVKKMLKAITMQPTNLLVKYVLNVHAPTSPTTASSMLFKPLFSMPIVYSPLLTIGKYFISWSNSHICVKTKKITNFEYKTKIFCHPTAYKI